MIPEKEILKYIRKLLDDIKIAPLEKKVKIMKHIIDYIALHADTIQNFDDHKLINVTFDKIMELYGHVDNEWIKERSLRIAHYKFKIS